MQTTITHRNLPPADRMSDRELARELTLAAGARSTSRKQLYDTLFAELQRRRRGR